MITAISSYDLKENPKLACFDIHEDRLHVGSLDDGYYNWCVDISDFTDDERKTLLKVFNRIMKVGEVEEIKEVEE